MKSIAKILFVAATIASSSMVAANDVTLSKDNSIARALGGMYS